MVPLFYNIFQTKNVSKEGDWSAMMGDLYSSNIEKSHQRYGVVKYEVFSEGNHCTFQTTDIYIFVQPKRLQSSWMSSDECNFLLDVLPATISERYCGSSLFSLP